MMALSTNWKQLREKLEQEKAKLVDEANNKPCNGSIISKHKKMARLAKKKAKRQRLDGERGGVDSRNSTLNDTESQKEQDELTNVLGLDCEYVGVGMDGGDNMLARISIVNMQGRCVYDKYVKPRENITDYRTAVSGIRPINLVNGKFFYYNHNIRFSKIVRFLRSFNKSRVKDNIIKSGCLYLCHSMRFNFLTIHMKAE
ncbi:unnamed protein product [Onchocerca flexuosa]|uniref:Exonuclease domain-containing protein n=1 Tax=Onchocerca flexuosa TaxID=387005 RepID=A0A183H8G7_9BILA|nr:unnamed protein product [Onchocerca flexuosa]